MCAVLNYTDNIKKMPSVLNDCREMGIKVLPPNINRSELYFSVSDNDILFGLDSVKGTKKAYSMAIINEREKNGEYISFKDFLKRNVADKSTAENLIKAGALDDFQTNRYAMLNAYTEGRELINKIQDKKEDLERMNSESEEVKEKKRFQTSYKKAVESLKMYEEQFDLLRIYDTPEDSMVRLSREKEVLGLFISAHPLDRYYRPEAKGCIPINDLEETKEQVSVMGIIQNLEIKRAKTNNLPMAFFDLEDKTGIIHVCCFTKSYQKCEELLSEDQIVKITGTVNVSTFENESDEESDLEIYMNEASLIEPDLTRIEIYIRSMGDWNETLKALKENNYIVNSGHPLIINDPLNNEFRDTEYYIKDEILNDEHFVTKA